MDLDEEQRPIPPQEFQCTGQYQLLRTFHVDLDECHGTPSVLKDHAIQAPYRNG
jgi:hypothetical protein